MSRPGADSSRFGASLIASIARLATRRARLVAAVWIVVMAGLAFLGRDLDQKLTLHTPYIDGTASKRAHDIALREFGSDYATVVMLRGPDSAVESQGRRLASRLDAMPRTLVVSPWVGGAAIDGLDPKPGVAALIVRVEGGQSGAVADLLPPVQSRVDETIHSPVRAGIAGFPKTVASMRSATEDAAKVGELIAVPVLFLVLLLVFRSVLAAMMPVIVGGAVVAATRGVLDLLLGLIQIDIFASGVAGMLGLALGVDYSLLVISRFREERKSAGLAEAVEATVAGTARSVVPAGSGLVLAMMVSALVLPGTLTRSVAISVSIATVLSVLSAVCVVPALLTLLGDNLDRWAWPRRRGSQVAPLRLSRRLAASPRAVVAILVAMVFLAAWAFTLKSNTVSLAFLPSGDAGRQQGEEVQDALGPGWIAPMEVIVDGRGGPVTSPSRLRALTAFQREVERDPGVQTMAGLARVAKGAEQLGGIEGELAEQERGIEKLHGGIAKLRKGADLNTDGLYQAAHGSNLLDSGIAAASTGAGALASALGKTSSGSGRLADGLGKADEGSGELSTGAEKASSGAGKLAEGLQKAREKTGEVSSTARLFRNAMRSGNERLAELSGPLTGTEEQLAAAWQALQRMTAGRADPEYAAVLRAIEAANRSLTGNDVGTGEQADPSYGGVDAGLGRAGGQFDVGLYLAARLKKNGHQASSGIAKLARGAVKLDQGLGKLAVGSRRLSGGITALARGGEALSPAMAKLYEGAERLAGGLGQLKSGSGRLAGGLGTGAEKSELLGGGLERINAGLERQDGGESGGSRLQQIQRQSPGLFHSAYFVLAGLDGSSPEQRTQVGSVINLDRGGLDARMLVIARDPPTSDAARRTKDRLEDDAEALARQTGMEVVVGGVVSGAVDANTELRDRSPLLRLALSLISFIVLIPVMRSLMIPILAALINVVTVSASFGLMSLLFNGSLLGGPGYVDATIIPGSMMVMFGLAIDYEVFVFARIREEYVRTGSTPAAIKNGLDQTAHVVTGAATIMIAVFLAFSVAEFVSVRNFGVAQALAVFIDAFIVRLIVIPAMMGWLGKWCWWMPGWLDRLLPGKSQSRGAEVRAPVSA
jgi:putative drug exporter of the RND superfamily